MELQEFNEVFESLVPEIGNLVELHIPQPKSIEWIQKSVRYNVPLFSQFRGLSTPVTYKGLVPDASKEDIKLANILGWVYQIHQQYILMMDDIGDKSSIRFGHATWHTLPEVGDHAINDIALMEHCAYKVLKKYFGHLGRIYHDLLDLLLDVSYKTFIGQNMEMSIKWHENREKFTMPFWFEKCDFKTGFPMYYLSFKMAIIFAGFTEEQDPELWKKFDEITFDLGYIIQLQDDYLDNFTMGNVDDIKNGTNNWIFIKAWEISSPEQRKRLEESYGFDDLEKIANVQEIYREVNVEAEFRRAEIEWCEALHEKVSKLPENVKGFGDGILFTLNALKTCVEQDYWN